MSDGNDDLSNVLAITALVISVVSFITALAQMFQQYTATANDSRRCTKSVMGLWAQFTRTRFRAREARFEVLFQTPIMFTAPPQNSKGPVPERPIYNVDGTKQSYVDTCTMEPKEQQVTDEKLGRRHGEKLEHVHTADDERASWVNLLASLQKQEEESRAWDAKNRMTPLGKQYASPDYTIVVQLQRKVRSWDFMSPSVTKPYATTTICHLVEMAAMLGMNWRSFDSDSWNLRAEGNGFIITSAVVQGQGVMLSFSVTGRSNFTDKRRIPCDELKSLSFGTVPTILGQDQNWGTVQEVSRTLRHLGCDTETIASIQTQKSSPFPMSFQIIGMLSRVFRIRGSNFKMIPNPTQVPWNHGFSFTALLHVFLDTLEPLAVSDDSSTQLKAIWHSWETLIRPVWEESEEEINIDLREAVHKSIDHIDRYLLKEVPKSALMAAVRALISKMQPELHANLEMSSERGFVQIYINRIRNTNKSPGDGFEAPPRTEEEALREDISITLLYRIICWYLLHDFDQDDVMILPSRLKGSRLPVFIS